jgi:hypothetical protein
MATTTNLKLSPEQKEKFLRFKNDIVKQEAERGDFYKFKDGDQKILRFNPDKIEQDVEIKNKKNEVIATGYWRFYARELVQDENSGENIWTEKEKEWTCAPSWAKKVLTRFAEGQFDLRITREGSDMQKTDYDIIPYLG